MEHVVRRNDRGERRATEHDGARTAEQPCDGSGVLRAGHRRSGTRDARQRDVDASGPGVTAPSNAIELGIATGYTQGVGPIGGGMQHVEDVSWRPRTRR
jgi:hypothetical protein